MEKFQTTSLVLPEGLSILCIHCGEKIPLRADMCEQFTLLIEGDWEHVYNSALFSIGAIHHATHRTLTFTIKCPHCRKIMDGKLYQKSLESGWHPFNERANKIQKTSNSTQHDS